MNKDPQGKWFAIAAVLLGVAAVLFGIALVKASVRLGTQTAGYVVLILFQILWGVAILVAVAVMLRIAGSIFNATIRSISQQIDDLRKQHAELAKRIQKRSPFIFAATIELAAEAVKIISDRSFEEETWIGLLISLGSLILFWIANKLALADESWRRICGLVLWLVTTATIFTVFMLLHGWNIKELFEGMDNPPEFREKLSLVVVTVVLFVIPFAFNDTRE